MSFVERPVWARMSWRLNALVIPIGLVFLQGCATAPGDLLSDSSELLERPGRIVNGEPAQAGAITIVFF